MKNDRSGHRIIDPFVQPLLSTARTSGSPPNSPRLTTDYTL